MTSGPHWGHPAPPEAAPNGHVPQQQPRPEPTSKRGWLRRNRIGLIALVPLLAMLVVVRWDTIYWDVWRSQPRLPSTVTQQQWVTFVGAQIRLAEFGKATEVLGYSNKPLELPAGVTVWKAVLEFKAPDQEAIAGCEISLEDSQNRTYGRGADELISVRGQSFVSCTKPQEQKSSEYATTVLFLTPVGVEPVAVQIRWPLQLPRYLRLSVDRG